jgi:hypothetical protein
VQGAPPCGGGGLQEVYTPKTPLSNANANANANAYTRGPLTIKQGLLN